MPVSTTIFSRIQRPRSSFWKFLLLAQAARRERKALAKLDATALDDIGLTCTEAHMEAAKPIWDVPANWRR